MSAKDKVLNSPNFQDSANGLRITKHDSPQKPRAIFGKWVPRNYMRAKGGKVINPNNIIGANLFDGLIAKDKKLEKLVRTSGEDYREVILNGNSVEVGYMYGNYPISLSSNGFRLSLTPCGNKRVVSEITWEVDGFKNSLKFKWEVDSDYMPNLALVHETKSLHGQTQYLRFSSKAGDLESKVTVDCKTGRRGYYVGGKKLKVDKSHTSYRKWPVDEFALEMSGLGDSGREAWHRMNTHMRLWSVAGLTNSNAIS